MNGFLGTYTISLDDKGRFNVPAKFRAALEKEYGPELVVCSMDNKYLVVFPEREWAENEKKLDQLNAFDLADRDRLRQFYAGAEECKMKSGKILIPANQRQIAALDRDAVLVGMSKTFEIWSPDRWTEGTG